MPEHYSQHKSHNESLGIFYFLKAQYCSEDDRENNSKEDMQLPFKSLHHAVSQTLIELPNAVVTFMPIAPECYQHPIVKNPVHLKLPVEYTAVICNPPRRC